MYDPPARRRPAANTSAPLVLSTTRVTRTVQAGHAAATPAVRAEAMEDTAAFVSLPSTPKAEAGSPPSCTAPLAPTGVGEGEREGVREPVGVPEGSTAAAATPSAPLSMRSCALPTPDSSSRCVSVPSVSSAERASRELPPAARRRRLSRRAGAVSALGGTFTEKEYMKAPEGSAATAMAAGARATTAAAAAASPSASVTLSPTAARKALCSWRTEASSSFAGCSRLSVSSNSVSTMVEGVEDSEGLPLTDTPEGAGVTEGEGVPVGDAGLEGDADGYAEAEGVAEGLTPRVIFAVGEREDVRVPVPVGVSEGVEDLEGVGDGVLEADAPGVREGVSVPLCVGEGVSDLVRVGVRVVERLAVRVTVGVTDGVPPVEKVLVGVLVAVKEAVPVGVAVAVGLEERLAVVEPLSVLEEDAPAERLDNLEAVRVEEGVALRESDAVPVPEVLLVAAALAKGAHARLRLLHTLAPTHTGGAARRVHDAPTAAAGHHAPAPLPPLLLLLPHSASEKAPAAAPRAAVPVVPSPPCCRTVKAAIGAQAAGVVP